MTNSSAAAATFNAQAAEYEAARRRLVPSFDAFYGAALAASRMTGRGALRILDLGAGTGLLSRLLREAHPDAELVLYDGAPAMLDQAREVLGDRAAYVVGDLEDELPAGPWDVVVSALAIHHLSDTAKQRLFARIHEELRFGGIFANADQVAGPTAFFDDLYRADHHAQAVALGASEDEWNAYLGRQRHDRCSSVEHQLQWLREAGFADADTPFRDHGFAVFVARRSG